MQIGLQATLYFEHGLSAETRRRVRECLRLYLAVARPHLRWSSTPDGEGWEQFNDGIAAAFQERLGGPAEDTWELQWHGARRPDEANEFHLEVFGQDQPGACLSYLRLAMPLGDLPGSAAEFATLVRRVCEQLLPYHGYGGVAFVESSDPGVKNLAQPMIHAMAQRFPGIEVDRPLIHLSYLADGIKGVHWLTVLGPRWVEAMGGIPKLRASLGEPFAFHEFDGSVLIQAGPVPQTGDRNQKLRVVLYPDLARLLKPIRIREHGSFDYFGPNRFTQETSEEWLARFDSDPW